jgi:GNAT superfamily N-acetyltransferase
MNDNQKNKHTDLQYSYNEMNPHKLYETLVMIRDVFMEFEAPEYTAEGIDEFLRFLEPDEIMAMLDEGKMRIWICNHTETATEADTVVGAIAAGKNHIYLLFVDKKHHRKGIAKRLLEIMIDNYKPTEITVNSSPYAIVIYQKLGFTKTKPEQTENGIRFTPMKKEFDL